MVLIGAFSDYSILQLVPQHTFFLSIVFRICVGGMILLTCRTKSVKAWLTFIFSFAEVSRKFAFPQDRAKDWPCSRPTTRSDSRSHLLPISSVELWGKKMSIFCQKNVDFLPEKFEEILQNMQIFRKKYFFRISTICNFP